MSLNPRRRASARSVLGFTMIEVLVTMVIMMFGLLGIAGLILKGQKAGHEAYQRNQALIFAIDMAEKMKTNRLINGQLNSAGYIAGGAYGMPLGAGALALPVACTAGTCMGAALIDFDLATWNNLLVGTQETSAITGGNVGGIVNARGCIEVSPVGATVARVSVAWQGDMDTVAPVSSPCGTGLYGTAGRRRVVSVDVL